jgi:hypothetical protein
MTHRLLLAAALLFATVGVLHSETAAADTRREAVKAADEDNNMRLDHGEMKNLKKSNPKMYDNLRAFCDVAKDHPKQHGVDLPADPGKKQDDCKKCKVAKPFVMAWIEQTEDNQPQQQPEQHHDNDGRSPSGG